MIPEDLRYHTEHEWIRLENDSITLGITHFAQDSLGDIVYLELPKMGESVQSGQEIGEVESTKTTSPIYTPVTGTVIEVNENLREQPDIVNKDPYQQGWILKIRLSDASEIDGLMTARQYSEYVKKEGD